jgi:hypothetical protein
METNFELVTGRIDQLENKKRQQLTPSASTNNSPRRFSSLRRRLNDSAEAANFDSAEATNSEPAEAANFDSAVAVNFETAEAGPWGMYYSDDESIPPTMPGPSFASVKAGPFKSEEDYASADEGPLKSDGPFKSEEEDSSAVVGPLKADDVGVEEGEEEFDPSSSDGDDSKDPSYREEEEEEAEEAEEEEWEEEAEAEEAEVDFDGDDESGTEEKNETELAVDGAKFKRGREPKFKLCGKNGE